MIMLSGSTSDPGRVYVSVFTLQVKVGGHSVKLVAFEVHSDPSMSDAATKTP